jgi:hypothetical protein
MFLHPLFAFVREDHLSPVERVPIMSQADSPAPTPKAVSKNVPDGLAKGIIGFVLGAGVSFLGMHFYGPREYISVMEPSANLPGIQAGPGIGAAPPSLGGGMAGAAGGNPGAPQNGSGAAGKRNLTTLVGKLELLSRDDLKLHLQFDNEQAAKLAAELSELRTAQSLTSEEAVSRLEKLQAMLTPEQRGIVDAIGLPRAAGGAPPTGRQAPDENPFAQESNEKRLNDLLGRLKSTGGETTKPAEQ